jgi:phosphatidylinositol glycan class W
MFRLTSRNKVPFSVFATVIISGYQWSLDHVACYGHKSIAAFIIAGERVDIFSQNREGVFSFFGILPVDLIQGYLSIFLVGLDVGRLILPANPPSLLSIQSPRIRIFVSLALCSIISIVAYQLTTRYFDIQVARRLVHP